MTTMVYGNATEGGRPRVAYVVGVAAYIVVVTIMLSTTTNTSHSVTGLVRIAAAAVAIICIVQLSKLRELSKRQFATIAMFLGLAIWATLGSMLSQSLDVVTEVMLIDICVVGMGLSIFSRGSGRVLPDVFSKIFVAYVALAFCLSLMTHGLILEFPPRFSFEYASDQYGAELAYGQGASNFYGLGAIASAFWLTRCGNILEKLLAAMLMVFSMSLSVIGGARGDTAIALLIVTAYLVLRTPGKAVLWIAALVLASVVLIDDWTWTEDLLFVSSILSIGEGDYGGRDQLFAQVLALLGLKPLCLVAGCGVGYFQHFYGYELEMYPHNAILESLLIFGLPFTAVFMFLIFRGSVMYYRRVGECDLFLLFTLYTLGVSLKSGSFFGSWLALAGCLYLASHSFVRWTDSAGAARRKLPGEDAITPGGGGRHA
jgi:hypothetical protein